MAWMPTARAVAMVATTLACAAPTAGAVGVRTETQLRAAWGDPHQEHLVLERDVMLSQCGRGDPVRKASRPLTVDGRGHVLRQTCPETRVLRQDGTGFVRLRRVTLTHGGADGPGAAIATRGEIEVVDSTISGNRSEDPGGGVFSAWGATVIRSTITGNLANDDGGGVYARRGGIRVFDSVIGSNLVDGSGGALASTGDILVVRSHLDGNTTDGDGGAIYADGSGDVTVVDSTVDGSTADGPGGGIFTVAGDVTVVNSTVNGNRAADRGGGIAGEGDVTVINSTISRNSANAHVAGGIWARGDLSVANSTISSNYAEGEGGGLLGAGVVRLAASTVTDNTAPLAANAAAGARLESFASIIGPAEILPTGGVAQPSARNCRAPNVRSWGWNLLSDTTCDLTASTDLVGVDPRFGPAATVGRPGETRPPLATSPAVGLVPHEHCMSRLLTAVVRSARHLDGVIDDPGALVLADQDGVPRGVGGAACTVGAVEVAP
jgi:predicted outer membrane repeat protein